MMAPGGSCGSGAGGERAMGTAEILQVFETTRIRDVVAFRALCNALKALVIKQVVELWRRGNKGRMTVLDLGCGRGGDLRKWACHRLRSFVGVDGGAACVQEAVERHAVLVAQGKSNVQASFHTMDVTREPLPVAAGSADAVSCMFFLQFAFASLSAAAHVLDEVARVLREGGVLCCILPDGDRVAQLLRERGDASFGHFRLSCLEAGRSSASAAQPPPQAPVGLAYNFSLTTLTCTEFVVSPRLLQQLLEARGFVGAGVDGGFFEGAQQFFSRGSEQEAVGAVLRGQRCSQVDWMSLGFFTVLLATKRPPEPAAEPAPQEPGRRTRRRGGG
jgi:SAM-dependent methyltransferase